MKPRTALSIGIVLWAGPSLAAGSGGLFVGGTPVPVEHSADILHISDLNGDGHPDVVAMHVSNAAVTVLRSDPVSGGFLEPVLAEVGFSPVYCASGDLDGDGLFDLVIANYGGSTCSVLLLRDGGSRYEPAASIPVGPGVKPRAVKLADLDRDGRLDLVLCVLETATVHVYRGDGKGGFSILDTLPVTGPPHTLVLEDFDGDDDADLAIPVFSEPGRIHWFEGTGDGTFVARGSLEFPGHPMRYSVGGDFDRDGRMDLAVLDLEGYPLFLRNKGAWSFRVEELQPGEENPGSKVDAKTWNPFLLAVDVDRDGDVDVVGRAYRFGEAGYRVWDNDGTGAFRPLRDTMLAPNAGAVALADFDQDGDVDAIATARENKLLHFMSDGGDLDLRVSIPIETAPRSLVRLSVPGAEAPRVAAFGTASVHVIAGSPEATAEVLGWKLYPTYAFTAAAAGDLDGVPGDEVALLDLLVPSVVIVERPGDPQSTSVEIEIPRQCGKLVVADFDGDGTGDVLASSQTAPELTFLSRPATSGAPPAAYVPIPDVAQSLATAHLDGDGRPDLVVGLRTGIRAFLNRGGGAFESAGDLDTGIAATYLTSADVDGDGVADVIALAGSTLCVVKAPGDPARRSVARIPLGFIGTAAQAADVSGDGRVDILVTARDLGSIAVLRNDGASWSAPEHYGVGSMPSGILVEDMDLDGRPDAVTADYESRAVSVLRGLVAPPGATFRRGDVDASGSASITDAILVLGSLFLGGEAAACPDAADANDDGAVNLTDAVYVLQHLFRGGDPPPAPGPDACGADPTEDELGACGGTCS